jgi:hypothetical protein
METLEFVIYPDGRVLEKVSGIVGASCAEVTAALENQLGQVTTQQPTSEYFAQNAQQNVGQQSVTTTQLSPSQGSYSQW